MAEPIVVSFELTRAEYVDGVRTMMLRHNDVRAMGLGGPVVLVIGLLTGSVAVLPTGFLAILAVVSLITVVPCYRYRTTPRTRAGQRRVFSDDGIAVTSLDVESQLNWPFYTQVVETRRGYVLMATKRAVNIGPKRAFVNPGDEVRFRDLVARAPRARFKRSPRD